MIAIRSSPASASVRRLRPGDARHPHGGYREVAEPGAGERPRTPRRRPGAEALFAWRTRATLPPARGGGRSRRFAPERELLGTLALAGGLAAAALLPGRPSAGADLWLAAAALGSGLALLLFGLRFRLPR